MELITPEETMITGLGDLATDTTTMTTTTMMTTSRDHVEETTAMSTTIQANDATTDLYLETTTDMSTVSININEILSSRNVAITSIVWLSIAILVNFVVLAVISCNPKKRQTKSNIYAASFIIANIFYCLNSIISVFQRVFLPDTEDDYEIEHVHLFIDFLSRGAMVMSLGGVVLDRYKAILDVTLYCSRRQLSTATCYAFAGWLMSILFAVPVLAGLSPYWYTPISNLLRPFDIYTGIHTAVVYFIPLLVFSIGYNGLMCRLITCSAEKRSLDSFVNTGKLDHQGTRRRLATGVVVTVGVFVLSWVLYLTVRTIDGFFPSSDFQTMNLAALVIAGNILAYIGLSVCPILVCLICADYRGLDAYRHCPCCSGDEDFMAKMQQAWPSSQSNPYHMRE